MEGGKDEHYFSQTNWKHNVVMCAFLTMRKTATHGSPTVVMVVAIMHVFIMQCIFAVMMNGGMNIVATAHVLPFLVLLFGS